MRTIAGLIAAPLAALAIAEVVMQPDPQARLEMGALFAVTAAFVAFAIWWFTRWVRRVHRLGRAMFVVAVAAVVVVGLVVTAASSLMFIEPHDLELLWIVVGFSLVLGVLFAVAVSRPLSSALARITETTRRIGAGELEARTGVRRRDEVGAAAAALDQMSARLEALEMERQKEEQARLAFLAAVGHDLRTPLAALRASVEAIEDGVADDGERFIRSMQEDVRALGDLVDDLFLLTKIESGRLEIDSAVVDLSDIVDDALESLRPVAARRGVALALETDGHVAALGDGPPLGRVIRNLVENAIRHSPHAGTVRVSVEAGPLAVVRVRDDGPGFRGEFVESAFEGFSRDDHARSRAAGGGAGLGLAIARGIVEAHGGSIWADPGPGGNVGFSVPSAVPAQSPASTG